MVPSIRNFIYNVATILTRHSSPQGEEGMYMEVQYPIWNGNVIIHIVYEVPCSYGKV